MGGGMTALAFDRFAAARAALLEPAFCERCGWYECRCIACAHCGDFVAEPHELSEEICLGVYGTVLVCAECAGVMS